MISLFFFYHSFVNMYTKRCEVWLGGCPGIGPSRPVQVILGLVQQPHPHTCNPVGEALSKGFFTTVLQLVADWETP